MLCHVFSKNMFCIQDNEMAAITLTPLKYPPPPHPPSPTSPEVPLVFVMVHYVCIFSNIYLTALLFYEVHVSLVDSYTKTYFVVLQGEVSEVSNHPQGYFFLYANTF